MLPWDFLWHPVYVILKTLQKVNEKLLSLSVISTKSKKHLVHRWKLFKGTVLLGWPRTKSYIRERDPIALQIRVKGVSPSKKLNNSQEE